MEETLQVTTKNPKKVEQGKKLAAFNKKRREEQKMKTNDDNNVESNNTTNICVGVCGIILIVGSYAIYKNYYKSSNEKKIVEKPIVTLPKDITPKITTKPNKFEME